MAVAADEFWQSLIDLGLIDSDTANRLRAKADSQTEGPADVVAVAKSLIARQVLTKFQAKQIFARRGGELRLGDYLILDRCEQPPLSRWYRGRHLPSGSAALIYPCTAATGSPAHVDPAWLLPHTAVSVDGLQPLSMVEARPPSGRSDEQQPVVEAANVDRPWRGWAVSALPAGETLDRFVARTGRLTPSAVLSLGELLGNALRGLHEASLPHGGIRPGRVWIGNEGSVYLLRCGGGPPIFPGNPTPPFDWFDDDGQAATFAAPEWLAGRSQATVQSDIFALAATLAFAFTGETPQAGAPPAEIAAALAAGPAGAPLPRILAAAMAADPTARFPDVDHWLKALATVATILNDPPTAPGAVADTEVAAQPDVAATPPPPTRQPPAESTSEVPAAAPTPKVQAKPKVETKPKVERKPTIETKPRAAVKSVAEPKSAAGAAPAAAAKPKVTPQSPTRSPLPPPDLRPSRLGSQPSERPAAGPNIAPATPTVAVSDSPTAATGRSKPRRTRRNRKGPIIIGSSAVAILLLLVAVMLRSTDRTPPPRPRPTIRPPSPSGQLGQSTPGTDSSAGSPTRRDPQDAGERFELVDDERLLWAPPWQADSEPPPLDLIVPGAQAFVVLRPQALLDDDNGADWLGWFGDELAPSLDALQQRCGVPADEIDRLAIGMVGGPEGVPRISLAVWLRQPLPLAELLDRWDVSASQTAEGQTIYTGDGIDDDAYFIPGESVTKQSDITAFAVGHLDQIRLVAEAGGEPLLLPPPMQSAWDQTSDEATVVALVNSNFLFADGRAVLQRFAHRAVTPLKNLLVPDASAVVVTLDARQQWYGEVRLVPGGGASSAVLLRKLQDSVAALPTIGESFLIDSDIATSWRALAIRLPRYYRALADQTRYGVSASLPTANFYLPAAAAPQITLASLLALSASGQPATEMMPTAEPVAMSIDQLLDTPMSISFEQESLEFAVGMIGDEFARGLPPGVSPPRVTIIGGDLEKSGITQNQQVRDFRFRDTPLREVLTRLVAGANPDKTATSPADPKQSLIWVVDPASTDAQPALLITTRPQAEAKNYPLPEEFVSSD